MSTLESYLTTIADAIREKKGTTEPINASNFASEILSIQGGGSLNVAYSLTPPTDTSKIWLQCAEPTSVEVQNYLGNVNLSEVANYGAITNPVDGQSSFYSGLYSTCYIGNNQIAIVGYGHIRIYNLTSKNYIADYKISVGADALYSNVLFKDNILYFGHKTSIYSFDLSTQTLISKFYMQSDTTLIKYICFYSSNKIDAFLFNSNNSYCYHYRVNLSTNSNTAILDKNGKYFDNIRCSTIKVNNTVYNFYLYGTDNEYYTWKYNLVNNTFTAFTSFINFMTNLGWTKYLRSSVVYDGERYIYLTNGNGTYNNIESSYSNLIIRYDTINDSFELLDQKLLCADNNRLIELIDNRIYMFGGSASDRRNQIDYFDLQYPLTQNNAIITTNTINTDNALPLINTDKLKLNSNIASAYKGNADNLAEKVNAYYWDGSKWVGINCDDYVGSSGTGGGLGGSGDATTDPNIPVDKPVEM